MFSAIHELLFEISLRGKRTSELLYMPKRKLSPLPRQVLAWLVREEFIFFMVAVPGTKLPCLQPSHAPESFAASERYIEYTKKGALAFASGELQDRIFYELYTGTPLAAGASQKRGYFEHVVNDIRYREYTVKSLLEYHFEQQREPDNERYIKKIITFLLRNNYAHLRQRDAVIVLHRRYQGKRFESLFDIIICRCIAGFFGLKESVTERKQSFRSERITCGLQDLAASMRVTEWIHIDEMFSWQKGYYHQFLTKETFAQLLRKLYNFQPAEQRNELCMYIRIGDMTTPFEWSDCLEALLFARHTPPEVIFSQQKQYSPTLLACRDHKDHTEQIFGAEQLLGTKWYFRVRYDCPGYYTASVLITYDGAT